MNGDSGQFIEIIKKFLKDNLLVVLLFTLGLILISSGLISLLSNKNQPEISFQKGLDKEEITPVRHEIITVDIEGAVLHPGVYTLEKESRLGDILIKAGGLSAQADRTYVAKQINLAKKISDGEKIYIPRQSEVSQGGIVAGVTSAENKMNINTAPSADLDRLPGIGDVTAQKIIEGRPYDSLEELLTKKIVSKSVFEKIKEKIEVY